MNNQPDSTFSDNKVTKTNTLCFSTQCRPLSAILIGFQTRPCCQTQDKHNDEEIRRLKKVRTARGELGSDGAKCVGGWVGGGVGENSLGKQRKKHSERGRGREGELFPMTAGFYCSLALCHGGGSDRQGPF